MKPFLAILCCLIPPLFAAEAKPDPKTLGPNLISNPGLEKLNSGAPAGWAFFLDKDQYKCKLQVAVDEKEKFEGQRSVRMFNFVREDSTIKREEFGCANFWTDLIQVDKEKTYFVSAKIKRSADMTKKIKVRGIIEIIDDTNRPSGSVIYDFYEDVGNGWRGGWRVVTPEMWKGFTSDIKFKWSKVRVSIGVFIDSESPGSVNVDDFYFGVVEPKK